MSLDWNVIFGVIFIISVFIYFFWNPFLDIFLYIFVPERVKITGVIIETKKERVNFYWPSMSKNNYLPISPNLIKVTDCYFVIKSNQYELPVTVEVSKNLFNSVFKNQEITIECKKSSWGKNTDYKEIKIRTTF